MLSFLFLLYPFIRRLTEKMYDFRCHELWLIREWNEKENVADRRRWPLQNRHFRHSRRRNVHKTGNIHSKNSIFYLFVILTIFLYTLCAFFRVFIEKRALSDKACLEKIHLFSKIFQKRYIKLPILEVVLIRPPVVMKLPLMMFPSIFFSVSWEVYF